MRKRAGVIVIDSDCVALIERNRGGHRYWVVPGGSVEPTDGSPRRHSYYRASVGSTEIRAVGRELDNPGSFGTYKAVWVRVGDLRSLDVRPAEIGALIAKHGDGGWPADLLVRSDKPF